MYNPQIKEKHNLIDLAKYGTESRKSIHSDVLIGTHPDKPLFREGDILDGNATLNLIQGAYNEGKVFEVFSKEGQKIAIRLDNIEQSTSDNYNELSQQVSNLQEQHNIDITRLNDNITATQYNIDNQRRVVDITLQSEEGGKKSYLVEKQNGITSSIVINDGDKGEKGDPFKYEDFTPEQIENLKVKGDKGDKGNGIASVKQTSTSYVDGGINNVRITLDDGSVSDIQVRNGHGSDWPEHFKQVLKYIMGDDGAVHPVYNEDEELFVFTKLDAPKDSIVYQDVESLVFINFGTAYEEEFDMFVLAGPRKSISYESDIETLTFFKDDYSNNN